MKLICILLIALGLCACTRRVEYSATGDGPAAPDAVNINVATVADLERLPHIGKKTAESIVEFRVRNGPFRRVEQVMLIRGVSEERFAALRPFLKVE